jgi:GMP synthase-like glutamine amidotransferase
VTKVRIHYLQHVPFEGLGSIETWLNVEKAQVSSTPLFNSAVFPQQDAFDGLIILGGPMSVNDVDLHPWLAPEIQFVSDTIATGKSVLGICLGAQIIAKSLGATILKNWCKEIGWFPVERIGSSNKARVLFPKRLDVFHWHGETFELPPGSEHLAASEACFHQAFLWKEHVLGMQFHLEMTPSCVENLIRHCGQDLAPGPYVQTPEKFLEDSARFDRIHPWLASILRYLFRT